MSNSKYFQRTTRPSLSPRRAGFSLIEVVIALGIFVFGALAIVRIFPGALGVIQNSEQRATAQRMAQTTLARYTNSPLSVPESVVDVHPAVYQVDNNEMGWSDFPGAVFGSGTRNESLPREPVRVDDISSDDSQTISMGVAQAAAGRFRRVMGEQRTVEREYDSTGTARGVITLRYPYILPDTALPVATQAVHNLRVSETYAINGVVVNSSGELDFTDATSSLDGTSVSDATNPPRPIGTMRMVATLVAPARHEYTFYVTYRWRNGAGPINSVVEEPKRFPDDANWRVLSGAPLAKRLDSSVTVVEGPVQVKVKRYIPLTSSGTGADVNSGLGRILLTNDNEVGRRVSVDYTVPDWRMIVHDDNLSTKLSTDDQNFLGDRGHTFGSPSSVQNGRQTVVPTRFLRDEAISAAPLASRRALVYALIRGTSTAPTTQGRVQYADAEWDPDKHSGSPDNVSAPTTTPYRVLTARPKTGQIFFDVTNTLSAPSARIVYRNQDGWLEQPSVAARSYIPFMDRAGVTFTGNEERNWPREPWREYFYNVNNASGAGSSDRRKAIVLHASEAGNTYLATYRLSGNEELRDVPVTAESEVVEVSQLGFSLGAFTGSFANGTATSGTTHVALLYLPDVNGYKIGLPINEGGSTVPQHVTSILSLRGSSVRVRSAWFDGSRYSQAAVTGYRSLDVESANRP